MRAIEIFTIIDWAADDLRHDAKCYEQVQNEAREETHKLWWKHQAAANKEERKLMKNTPRKTSTLKRRTAGPRRQSLIKRARQTTGKDIDHTSRINILTKATRHLVKKDAEVQNVNRTECVVTLKRDVKTIDCAEIDPSS